MIRCGTYRRRLRLEALSIDQNHVSEATLEPACPLSLQDLCLLRAINDVESYPVWLLASLPHWLRNQLLSNLTVLDLCHLECTPIAAGVNVDEIWSTKLADEPKKRSVLFRRTPRPVRPFFIANLFQMTLYTSNTNSERDPRVAKLKTETVSAFQSRYHRPRFTDKKEEYLMILTAKALSSTRITATIVAQKLVSLHGASLSQRLGIAGQKVWNKQATSLAINTPNPPSTSSSLLRRQAIIFLTPHRLLPICENADPIELLSLLTHTCRVRPTSVCLDVDMISQPILDNLQAEKIVIDNGLPVPPDQMSCLSIMKCLMEDVTILRVQSLKYLRVTGPMVTLIEAAMANGKLKSLFCSIPSLYMETVQLFSKLFLAKNIYLLHLEIDDFSPQTMIYLLQAFMTVPCVLAQKLVISISETNRHSMFLTKQQLGSLNVGFAVVPECALHHKTLQLYPQNHTLQFLLLLPSIQLTELKLCCDAGTVPYFHLCASHPDLQVTKLELYLSKCATADETKLLKATIEKDLQLFLAIPTLREVLLNGNWFDLQEAKQGIIHGLHHQNQPDLQMRKLTLDMVGYSDEEIQDLLKVITSFPEHYRPRVLRGKTFLEAAKKTGMIYDKIYNISLHGFVSRNFSSHSYIV